MPHRILRLDPDPVSALDAIRAASRERSVLVFKQSPICPVSTRAEGQLERWLESLGEADDIAIARIDVIAERALARGLTRELGIEHQSPQALWFAHGELVWHDSHGAITVAALDGNRQF
ncbi:MAG: bacillithiol system redox-active protein YtxJ [Planctomycetota bacterium]|nr:MAG: bacillithiol system redox-active protein YtxJ [Planctomycetota bacterium]